MPLARLCRTPRILGRVRSLLLGLLLDTAALLLRTLGGVPLSLCPHVGLCRPRVAAQDCSVTGGWLRCRGRPLPLFDDLQPLCRFFLALSVVEFDLLHPQPRLGITHPCANAAQAVFHSEALVTGRLVLLPLDPKSLTLAPDAFMLRRTLLRSGGSYNIVPAAELLGPAEVTPLSGGDIRVSPGFGLSVIPLRYISAQTAAQLVQPMVARADDIRVDTSRNLLLFSGTGAERQNVVETLADLDVNWLAGKSIGLTLGYVYPGIDEWIQRHGLLRQEAISEEINLEKLRRGRIDCVAVSESAARYFVRLHGLNGSLTLVDLPGHATERRFLVPLGRSDLFEKVAPIVRRMREDLQWLRMASKYQ